MLSVHFSGRVKQKSRLENFACDVINEILPREFKRDVEIHVRFCKIDGVMGYASVEEKDVITIEVDNRYPSEIVAATLAHELVHAKQYIRGELNPTMTRWMKQEIPYGPRGGLKIRYRQQPWEKEAFKREKELTEWYWYE